MGTLASNEPILRDDVMAGVWQVAASESHLDASGLPLTFADGRPVGIEPSTLRSLSYGFKRVMDLVLGSAALVALGPLLIITALAIRLTSPGPALFRQDRDGLNGKVISIYKFRSMFADRGDITGVAQTKKGDARITPIGHFIRRTSIDELPQLINVIKGDMSLVGPRPHPIGMLADGKPYEALVPYYHDRHAMKPGISGWAQANGLRGATDNARIATARIEHDVAYVQNFSILLDIKIIFLTIRNEFITGTGN